MQNSGKILTKYILEEKDIEIKIRNQRKKMNELVAINMYNSSHINKIVKENTKLQLEKDILIIQNIDLEKKNKLLEKKLENLSQVIKEHLQKQLDLLDNAV